MGDHDRPERPSEQGTDRVCASCGQRVRRPGPCDNPWCQRADRAWSVIFAAGVYAGTLRRAIVDYKYRGRRCRLGGLVGLLADYLQRYGPWLEEFDLMVPMPSYQGQEARRSWDPVSAVLAGAVDAAVPAWEVGWGAVTKRFETPALSGRSRFERVALAEGPLRRSLDVPDPDLVAGARILVVDDVFTEGATWREVARVLRRAGAVEVAGLV
ncbi:MAG: ComF family protein, partial [Acidimicrobiales bacterium]